MERSVSLCRSLRRHSKKPAAAKALTSRRSRSRSWASCFSCEHLESPQHRSSAPHDVLGSSQCKGAGTVARCLLSGGLSSSLKMSQERIASVVPEMELRRTFKLPGVAGSYQAPEWWLAKPSMLRTSCLSDGRLSHTSFGILLPIVQSDLLLLYLQEK